MLLPFVIQAILSFQLYRGVATSDAKLARWLWCINSFIGLCCDYITRIVQQQAGLARDQTSAYIPVISSAPERAFSKNSRS
eukprot:scaffold512013_cov18-Prasinocladus_malaysianus.AAC.1